MQLGAFPRRTSAAPKHAHLYARAELELDSETEGEDDDADCHLVPSAMDITGCAPLHSQNGTMPAFSHVMSHRQVLKGHATRAVSGLATQTMVDSINAVYS
jgi:hypothetical protein